MILLVGFLDDSPASLVVDQVVREHFVAVGINGPVAAFAVGAATDGASRIAGQCQGQVNIGCITREFDKALIQA